MWPTPLILISGSLILVSDFNYRYKEYLTSGSGVTCIEHIPKHVLKLEWRTADEIRRLVDQFLQLRKLAVPSKVSASVGSQQGESQDEYGGMTMNMDDPDLIEALRQVEGQPDLTSVSALDRQVAKVKCTNFCIAGH
jgi:hypothetical protein